MRFQREPTEFFETVIAIYEQVNRLGVEKAFEGKPKEKTFFFDQFITGTVKTLISTLKKDLKDDKFKALLVRLPDIIAVLLANNIDNVACWEGMRNVFDPTARFY